jgi:hypothetical protein
MDFDTFAKYRKTLESKSEIELIKISRTGTDDVQLAVKLEIARREKAAQQSFAADGLTPRQKEEVSQIVESAIRNAFLKQPVNNGH